MPSLVVGGTTMRTASSTTPRPTTYDELAEQYKSANYRFKEKRQLVSDDDIQSFIHEWIMPASLLGIFILLIVIGVRS